MSSEFSTVDIDRLARLARLELSADEKVLFAGQLGAILRYAEQIQSVETAGVAPAEHAAVLAAPLRDDEVTPSLAREDTLAAAPATDAARQLFKVPRVLG